MTVLDGRDGRPLLSPYPRDSIGAQTSPLSIGLQGAGNDLFLYWVADCVGHEGDGGEFGFKDGECEDPQGGGAHCASYDAGLTLNDMPSRLLSKHWLNFQVFTNYNVIYIYHDHPPKTAMAFHSHSNSHSQS